MKKSLMFCLLGLISFVLFGFKINNSIKPKAMNPEPLKYLCSYYECPGHMLDFGPRDCSYIDYHKLYFSSYNELYEDIESIRPFFENRKYVVTNEKNNSNIINERADYFGLHKMNRHYYYISSHGGKYGEILFSDNKDNGILFPSSFPMMDNVQLAFFSICYGGKKGNAADIVVSEKGAQYAIGWEDTIRVDAATHFLYYFSKFYCENYERDIDKTIRQTIAYLRKKYYWESNGYAKIYKPILYSKNSQITYYNSENNENSTNIRYYNGFQVINNRMLFNNITNFLGNESVSSEVVLQEIKKIMKNSHYFSSYKLNELDSFLVRINGKYHLIKHYECYYDGKLSSVRPYYLDTHTNTLLNEQQIESLING